MNPPVPRRSLLRRCLLLYFPARPGGWLSHLIFYVLAFFLMPLFTLLGVYDFFRPGGAEGGFVAPLFIGFLTIAVHRRAVYKGVKIKAVMPDEQDNRSNEALPFSFETPPRPKPVLGYFMKRLGDILVVLNMIGPVMFLVGLATFIISILDLNEVFSAYWSVFLGLVFAGPIFSLYCGSLGQKTRVHGRRMSACDGRPIVLQNKHAPVLILRSFEDEALIDPRPFNQGQYRYEELLAGALKTIGPVITIGHPGDEIGYSGAARLYVANSHWQQAVEYLMQRSAAVLIIVGQSEGLSWEIEQALVNIDRKRLLFFFPYVSKANLGASRYENFKTLIARSFMLPATFDPLAEARQRRYQHFRLNFSAHFDGQLPEQLGHEQFIDFTENGQVRLLKGKKGLMAIHPESIFFWPGMRILNFNVALTIKPFVRKLLARA